MLQTDCTGQMLVEVSIQISVLVILTALTVLTFRAAGRSRGWIRLLQAVVAGSLLFVLGSVIWLLLMLEMICPFDPYVDTCFAPGYSKKAFEAVEVGMSETDVTSILGEPLSADPAPEGISANPDRIWSYTRDGCAPYGDFAWYGQHIGLKEGRVVSKWCVWHGD